MLGLQAGPAYRPAHIRAPGKRRQFLARAARILQLPDRRVEELFCKSRGASVRVNRLSSLPPESILEQVARHRIEIEPLPWCPHAYVLHSPKHLVGQSELFQDGHLYIQNASSLLPPLVLDPQRGEAILDVCAAPGGKAAHIAAIVENDCELWLNDLIKPRLDRLREVVATFGLRPAQITDIAGQYVDKAIDRRFDRILLDAQCSAEGRIDLRRNDALALWSTERIEHCGRLQQRMLVSAFKLLQPGGTLVYATCTLAPEENEAPVSHLLTHNPHAHLAPIDLELPQARKPLRSWGGVAFHQELQHARRIAPDTLTEAFFVAKIVKDPAA